MNVDVSGQKFIFPPICACCGGHANGTVIAQANRTTGKRVVRTSSKSWDFPYCQNCLAHVKAARNASTVQSVGVIASLFFGGIIGLAVNSLIASIIISGLCVILSLTIGHVLLEGARKMCSPDCVNVRTAVQYRGWYGNCHSFYIQSQEYAFAFMKSNEKKLINVQPNVWNWLQTSNPPSNIQSAKRRQT